MAVTLVGLVLAGFVVSGAMNGWLMALRTGNEAATIQNLKTVAVVESQYFYSHRRTFGTFPQLVAEQMLSSKFAANPATADGYVLTLTLASDAASYTLVADPASTREGTRHFYVDSISRQIHVNPDKPAGPDDPIL